ncbi:hypothetical protein P3T76_004513 [Phytophthora citrophthora]|uniref:Uncharacterized protein n=1 Tax=Phytophthora citrophthora TaxID=4793 RepID=A0AAD9LQG3_9STRA|nr:hypothetical protein P3T76_004513 [Phytophthora citrophthora]
MATKEEAIGLVSSSSSSDELFDAEVAAVTGKPEDLPTAEQQRSNNDAKLIDLTFSSDDEPNEGDQEPGTCRGGKRLNMEIYAAAE